MLQNYHDAMAICRQLGMPYFFITFTSNPQWQEIYQMLLAEQKPEDRPDVVTRVFKIKLDKLLQDIKKNKHFGEIVACTFNSYISANHFSFCNYFTHHSILIQLININRCVHNQISKKRSSTCSHDSVVG